MVLLEDGEHVNPATPTTTGALLAEEIFMDPYSALPSFLEMMMIEEMLKSLSKGVSDGLQTVGIQARDFLRTRSGDSPSSSLTRILSKIQLNVMHLIEFGVRKYRSEIQLLVVYLIHRQKIMASCATFPESIYGGKRAKVYAGRKLREPTVKDKTRLALLLALSGYLKEKLDTLFHKWKRISSPNNNPCTSNERLQKLFTAVYPFLHMSIQGSVLGYHVAYLLGRSVYFDPISHFLQLVVRRITVVDTVNPTTSSTRTQPTKPNLLEPYIPLVRQASLLAVSGLCLVTWLTRWRQYTHQIVREERSEEARGAPTISDLPPPPRSPKLNIDPNQRIRLPLIEHLCPLCQQQRINPAALPSGFVFCNKCIVFYIRQHKSCPLTSREFSEKDIVRIYEPQGRE